MDTNTLYAATMVGRQADYDDYIVKEVWAEGHSNMTGASAESLCERVAESQGNQAYKMCKSAALSCGTDAACDEMARKYAAALSKGYSKSFDSFKKRSETLGALGDLGTSVLGMFSSPSGGQGAGQFDTNPQPRKRTGLYIALGVVALAGIGAAIYFAKKD